MKYILSLSFLFTLCSETRIKPGQVWIQTSTRTSYKIIKVTDHYIFFQNKRNQNSLIKKNFFLSEKMELQSFQGASLIKVDTLRCDYSNFKQKKKFINKHFYAKK